MQPPKLIKLPQKEQSELIERVNRSTLSQEDRELIGAALDTLAFLSQAYENKKISIKRLLKMIFGPSSEKSKDVIKEDPQEEASSESLTSTVETNSETDASAEDTPDKKKKRKGHGRNGATAYTGAEKEFVPHPDLVPGDPCPECPKGKVYRLEQPQVFVKIEGGAPITAKVTEFDQLRCNLCGTIFTSKPPALEESKAYDENACAIIALLKYGHGFPFYRLEKLQQSVGIPLPSSTQWDLVKASYHKVLPAYDELLKVAAQGDVLHNDDTTVKILEIMREERTDERTGTFTTGIVSQTDEHSIALFFSGVNHAGENLATVLQQRDADRSPPIHMCDALSRNYPKDFKTILCNCLTHGRRRFVDVLDSFPDECRHVIKTLAEVYKHDDITKKQHFSDQERLVYHQTHSGPLMQDLQTWLNDQIEQKTVEPNSGLGEAISYMLNHWPKLTRFLEVPGAPLDNNVAERILKQAILNRKNAYFFKTRFGAAVGDLFMSVIHTCILSKINPFNYLVALLTFAKQVAEKPENWLPWNYQLTVAALTASV